MLGWDERNGDDNGGGRKGCGVGLLGKRYMGGGILDGRGKGGDGEWGGGKDVLWEIIDREEYDLMDNYGDNLRDENENKKE